MLRTHAQTAGCSLTAQQPLNNVVRVAIQALAGVLGGTQSLHTNSMDETLALPTEQAVLVALRTQQIIAEETGVANTVDPLGGSYSIEALTDRLEREAIDYIERIDDMGGIVRAIELGFPQQEIAEAAYHFQRQLDRGEKVMVGVNKYQSDDGAAARAPAHRHATSSANRSQRVRERKAGARRRRASRTRAGGGARRGRGRERTSCRRSSTRCSAECTRRRDLATSSATSSASTAIRRGSERCRGKPPTKAGNRRAGNVCGFSSPSPASTATTAAPRSSRARCATPASR